jgi:competence protein ComEA
VWKSLAIKAGMLVATMVLVVWIGLPPPHDAASVKALPAGESVRRETVLRHEPTTVAPTPPVRAPIPAVVQSKAPQGKLNLNRATAEDLQHLPGIGPVLAQRVVDRRTKHGPFHTVDDLRDVKGIGKKRMDQLRPLVTIDPTGNGRRHARRCRGRRICKGTRRV